MFIRLKSAKPTVVTQFVRRIGALLLATAAVSAYAAVTGTVYLDYNANGVKDNPSVAGAGAIDVGIGNVTVTATGAGGSACGSATTSTASGSVGTYSLTPTCADSTIRLEFTIPAGYTSGHAAQTSVRFVSPTATNIDLPLVQGSQFCQNNPDLCTSTFLQGNAVTGTQKDRLVLRKFAFSSSGDATVPDPDPANSGSFLDPPAGVTPMTKLKEIGSVYGLAWQKAQKRLFAAAYLKKLTGFGPAGPGAIYTVDAAGNATVFANIDTMSGTNFGPGAAGTDPFSGDPVGNVTAINNPGVGGQTGWGDIDLNEDQTKLYALNLKNLLVYQFDATQATVGSGTVLAPMPWPTTGTCALTRKIKSGGSEGKNALGMGVFNGALFVAGVCSTDFGGAATHYVFRYDGTSWTTVFSGQMSYTAPGPSTYGDTAGFGVISDIAFDRGDLILSTRGMTIDWYETTGVTGSSTGTVLRACAVSSAPGTTYMLESGAACPAGTVNAGLTGAGTLNTGPNTNQNIARFFGPQDADKDSQTASQVGGIALIPGNPVFATTSYDQFGLFQGSASWFNATTGANARDYTVVSKFTPLDTAFVNRKSNVMGELEALCDAAPVEIGNRVWKDLNGDGVQDAEEPPIAGVTVQLKNAGGTVIATATTNSNGEYVFSNDQRGYPTTGNDGTATGGFVDNGQGGSTSTTAFRYGVPFASGDALKVVIPNAPTAVGMPLTNATQGGNTAVDSNFTLVGSDAEASVTVGAPGANNHTIDAGFVPPTTYSIGDVVWNDANNNGKIDAGESTLLGAKVELFQSDAAGAPTGAAVGTITTDSTGRYRFDGLAAGDYVVVVTPPVGYVSSTGTAISGGNTTSDELDNGIDTKIVSGAGAGGYPSGKITLAAPVVTGEKNNSTTVPAASVNGSGGEAVDNRSNRTVDFGFYQPFDLKVNKAVSNTTPAPYTAGVSPVSFDLSATNLGPGSAGGNVSITDCLPVGLTYASFTSVTTGEWICNTGGSSGVSNLGANNIAAAPTCSATITCTRTGGALAANGSSGVVRINATINVGVTGALDNFAVVTPDPVDANKPELIPVSTINNGYEDGSNTGNGSGTNPSNNDHRASITVGAPTFSLGNKVWFDSNNNGAVDSGEAGIDGVVVEVWNSDAAGVPQGGTPVATDTTQSGGYYLFKDLPAGNYVVVVKSTNFGAGAVLSGLYSSGTTQAASGGTTEVAASTDTTATGTNKDHGMLISAASGSVPAGSVKSGVYALGLGQPTTEDGNATPGRADTTPDNQSNLTADFGFYAMGIGNLVFRDDGSGAGSVANDGTRQSNEPILSGVTVKLYADADGNGTPDGAALANTTTDNNGNYLFTGLPEGRYVVEVTAPTGLFASAGQTATSNATADDNKDHGGAITGGVVRSGTITLVALSGTATGEVNAGATLAATAQPNGLTPATTNLIPDRNINSTIDFGFYGTYSLGDRVWIDSNNNGTQDTGEVGLNGVTVTLLDGSGAPLYRQPDGTVGTNSTGATPMTTTTATAAGEPGRYSFTDLTAGDYKVQFTLPANYQWTGKLLGGNTAKDSDAAWVTTRSEATATTATITLGGSSTTGDNGNPLTLTDPKIDAGVVPLLSLGDRVWIDSNGNGTQDSGEVGIDGVKVELLNGSGQPLYRQADGSVGTTATATALTVNTSTQSGQVGSYKFDQLPPGDYQVRYTLPTGYMWTVANNETAPSNDSSDSDAIFTSPTAATAKTATITLSATPVTDSQGNVLTLTNPTVDAGVTLSYSLGNRVWVDADNNGSVNGAEAGLDGVPVALLDSTGAPLYRTPGGALTTAATGNTAVTTTTANGGYYLFTGLPAGNYRVEIDPPTVGGTRYVSSTGTNGSQSGPYEPGSSNYAAAGNSLDHGTQQTDGKIRSSAVTLGPGMPTAEDASAPTQGDSTPDAQSNLTVDFGIFLPAKLGNLVWTDTNKDGKADTGEPGINGITVILRDAAGTEIARQTTRDRPAGETSGQAGPGFYQFTNLLPGQYRVEFQAPGYLSTVAGAAAGTSGTQQEANNSQLPPNVSVGQTALVTVGAGDNNPQLDAGFVAAPPVIVPTMTQWGQLMLLLMVIALAGLGVQRRKLTN